MMKANRSSTNVLRALYMKVFHGIWATLLSFQLMNSWGVIMMKPNRGRGCVLER